MFFAWFYWLRLSLLVCAYVCFTVDLIVFVLCLFLLFFFFYVCFCVGSLCRYFVCVSVLWFIVVWLLCFFVCVSIV